MGETVTLTADVPVAAAVTAIRERRAQLALVAAGTAGTVVGIATMEDLLEELIGEFDDETDTPS